LFCLQYNIYFFVFIAATAVPPATTSTASPDYTDELVTEEPETSCTAIRSGDFNDQNTWENGLIPSGLCSIIISAGKTVTFSNAEFDIEVPQLESMELSSFHQQPLSHSKLSSILLLK